jgi:hypothetical protein
MTVLWIYLAFSVGVIMGCCLFAALAMAKEEQGRHEAALEGMSADPRMGAATDHWRT